MPPAPFNAKTWAEGHEKLCAERYDTIGDKIAWINRILLMAGTALLALLGFLAKNQYDGINQQLNELRNLRTEIHSTKQGN